MLSLDKTKSVKDLKAWLGDREGLLSLETGRSDGGAHL